MAPSTKKSQNKKMTSSIAKKKGAPPTVRDPDSKPKRPLSAYNLFFQYERDMLLRSRPSKEGQSHETMHMTIHNDPSERRNRSKTVRPPPHGKIGFAELAKIIGSKWKSLDDPARKHFQDLAAVEKKRYVKECNLWKERMERKKLEDQAAATSTKVAVQSKEAQEEKKNDGNNDFDIAAVGMVKGHDMRLPLDDDVLSPVPEIPAQSFSAPGQAHPHAQQNGIYDMLNRACEIAEEGICASSSQPTTSDMGQMPSAGGISYTIGAPTPYITNTYGYNNYQHQQQVASFAPPTSTTASGGLPHPQHTNVAPNTYPREGHNAHDGAFAPRAVHRHHQLPATNHYQHQWNTTPNCSSKTLPVMKAPRVVSNGSIGAGGVGFAGGVDNSNFDGDILDFLSRIVSD